MKKASSSLAAAAILCSILTCYGCKQEDIITVITDGAEAGTVAAVLALQAALPLEAALIIKGMKTADAAALALLNNPANTTLTLQELLNLAMITDPNLSQYQAIIRFVLPVIAHIPGVKNALNLTLAVINPTVLADVQAFFVGMQNGLAFTGQNVETVLACKSKRFRKLYAANAAQFDTDALKRQFIDNEAKIKAAETK